MYGQIQVMIIQERNLRARCRVSAEFSVIEIMYLQPVETQSEVRDILMASVTTTPQKTTNYYVS